MAIEVREKTDTDTKTLAYQPLGDKVLVLPVAKEEEQSRFGIFIPDSARELNMKAVVVAVGPGGVTSLGYETKPKVQVADTVIYNRHAGIDITIKDQDYVLLSERDIYMRVYEKEVAEPATPEPRIYMENNRFSEEDE